MLITRLAFFAVVIGEEGGFAGFVPSLLLLAARAEPLPSLVPHAFSVTGVFLSCVKMGALRDEAVLWSCGAAACVPSVLLRGRVMEALSAAPPSTVFDLFLC